MDDTTAGISREHTSVGTQDPFITGHGVGGLEAASREAGERSGGEDANTDTSDGEREGISSGGGDGGGSEGRQIPTATTREIPSQITSQESASLQGESVLCCDDPPSQHPETDPSLSLAAGPKEGAGTQGHTRSHLGEKTQQTDSSECIGQRALLREASTCVTSASISQGNIATTDNNNISSPSGVEGDTNNHLAISAIHSSNMHGEEEEVEVVEYRSQALNNNISDEATFAQDPFTNLSPPDAADHMREEEEVEEGRASVNTRPVTLAQEPKASVRVSSVLNSETRVLMNLEDIDRENNNTEELKTETVDSKSNNNFPTSATKDPDVPWRPHRRTHKINTMESSSPSGSSASQITIEESDVSAGYRDASGGCVYVPGDLPPQQEDGKGGSGSSQGHLNTHTPESFEGEAEALKEGLITREEEEETLEEGQMKRERVEEEMKAIGMVMKKEEVKEEERLIMTEVKEEVKESKMKEEKSDNSPVTEAFTSSRSQQKREDEFPLITTTTSTQDTKPETQPSEDTSNDLHAHQTHTHNQPVPPSASASGDSCSVSSVPSITAASPTSPLKPKRSSRTDLRKPRLKPKPESIERRVPEIVPARPARRKKASVARGRSDDSVGKLGKEEQVTDVFKAEIAVMKLNEHKISDDKRLNENEKEEKKKNESEKPSDKHKNELLLNENESVNENESITERTEASGTAAEKGKQGRSDSRLAAEGETQHEGDTVVDGGGDSGSHAEGERLRVEGGVEQRLAVEGESLALNVERLAVNRERLEERLGEEGERPKEQGENLAVDGERETAERVGHEEGGEKEGEKHKVEGEKETVERQKDERERQGGEGERQRVDGGDNDTLLNLHQHLRLPTSPPDNTDNAAAAAGESGGNERIDVCAVEAVGHNTPSQPQGKDEPVLSEDLREGIEEDGVIEGDGKVDSFQITSSPLCQDAQILIQEREDTYGEVEKATSFVITDTYSKDTVEAFNPTFAESGITTERQVPPPRRKRNKSATRSLHQEDMTADLDTGQASTAPPIPPVRRKRQFSSLPRPAKTKPAPRDVSPSHSTSALVVAASSQQQQQQRRQTTATHQRSVSDVNIRLHDSPELPSFPEHNGAARKAYAETVEGKTKVEAEFDRSRRQSEGSLQEERKSRSLKKTLKRTGSLRNRFYSRIQQKIEKSSRLQTNDEPRKNKYLSRIFHRKQKLYDMSGPSHYPSEIPEPLPPNQHLAAEKTETFATLLSSYFAPDTKDLGKADGETITKYSTLERISSGHSTEHRNVTVLERSRSPEKQPPTTTKEDDLETKALLQESQENQDSGNESVNTCGEGNTNEAFVREESDPTDHDPQQISNVKDEGSQNETEEACIIQRVSAAAKGNPEEANENCIQPPLEDEVDSEAQDLSNNTNENTSEIPPETEDLENTTQDADQTCEVSEEDSASRNQQSDTFVISCEDNCLDARVIAPPSPPPPPPPPADEESPGLEERSDTPVYTWERPTVRLRTWAERQGIKSLTLPSLNLRPPSQPVDLEALDYYCESDDDTLDRDTPSPGPPVDGEKEGGGGRQQRGKSEEPDRTQKDRCVEVYPETVRQRQRNMMATNNNNNKVDIKNWNGSHVNNNNDTLTSPSKSKKFLPSVKALRNQFEAGKTPNGKTEVNGNVTSNGTTNGQTLSRRSSSSSVASNTPETPPPSTTVSHHSPSASVESLGSSVVTEEMQKNNDQVEPIFNQFRKVDQELRELMSKGHSTSGWDPRPLLKRLYYIPEAPKLQSKGTTYVNIEGYLEKLPSGRKKATFWNAWKRRYFMAKNGVLYYYQSAQTDKPSMKMTLMGGKVECMEPNMVGVDDGKGHYVVVRCSSRQEAERWHKALETHTVEDFTSQYVQPWPLPTNPTLLRDTLIVDIGSASIRAGVLASQATLPQVFIPSVVASGREGRGQVWGLDALAPDVRASSNLTFPIRPTHKISKYSVDLSAVSSLLQKAFAELKVDPKNYHVQLSVPRVLNTNTQAELLRVLFDKFSVRSVNLTHQSILALYAYNATSGIVVDVGERMDIVPVIDGYIVDGGVSRVPYGGYRILDHLRQFLYMRNISLINEVESYIIRQVLESICYCAHHYNTEKARCTKNSDHYEKSVSLAEYFSTTECPYESISLDFGRFQATEGLFNPDAWGLDHPGLHKLVHKAIMECSMDIRKEMSRSVFLAGGVTQLPGLVERLTTELDNLTPPAIRPKVHASPYRYHAAYIGACVLAESPAFTQSRIALEDWNKHGNATLRKWSL